MFLSRHAASVRLLIRGDDIAKSMSRYLLKEIDQREQIEVLTTTKVAALHGEHGLDSITVEDVRTGVQRDLETKALFVFIGASPHTEWLRGHVAMDEHCFVLTGRDVADEDLSGFNGERPYLLETSQAGIFAVGDVHAGSIKRVASAVGEGSMAIQLIHQRLAVL
jgi:thioredoxin reductase (NADPH)